MYKIIGADGRQYGPVSAEQLRQWVSEGRANSRTLALAEGSTEWQPLSSLSEFGGVTASAAVPPMPSNMLQGRRTNSMAIAALVMGALSVGGGFCLCGPLLSVLGVIFGAIGISQVNKNPQTETGKALAVWGLVLSVVGLVFAIAFVIFFIVVGCLEQACVP